MFPSRAVCTCSRFYEHANVNFAEECRVFCHTPSQCCQEKPNLSCLCRLEVIYFVLNINYLVPNTNSPHTGAEPYRATGSQSCWSTRHSVASPRRMTRSCCLLSCSPLSTSSEAGHKTKSHTRCGVHSRVAFPTAVVSPSVSSGPQNTLDSASIAVYQQIDMAYTSFPRGSARARWSCSGGARWSGSPGVGRRPPPDESPRRRSASPTLLLGMPLLSCLSARDAKQDASRVHDRIARCLRLFWSLLLLLIPADDD